MSTATGQTSLTGAAASSTSAAASNARAATTGSVTGAIVGGVIGGIVLIVLVIGAMYYVYRRGRRSGLQEAGGAGTGEPKVADTTLPSGKLAQDESASLEATDGNLVSEPNAEIEPVSHALRYLDAERLGTASV